VAAVEAVLREVLEALHHGSAARPRALCLGMAGADRDEDRRTVEDLLRRISSAGRVLVVNDALVALAAGVGDAPGIVLVSGTGSIVYGRSARGTAARAGGFGRIFGDEASGYWLGRRALQAVARASDGRGPATRLSALVLGHFGVERARDLTRRVNTRASEHRLVSGLAPLVEEARRAGDALAGAILEEAAGELLSAAAAVADRLGMRDDAFAFVLAGGAYKASPWLADELARRLPALAPRATVTRLEAEPARGAVSLALADTRGGVRLPAYVD
jgi:N-acetylglucosamine kinase-like BadF-type ATPase